MISGGTKPPRPPAAPTTPVTEPTLSAGATLPTRANTAPLAAPSSAGHAEERDRAERHQAGAGRWSTANAAAPAKHPVSTGTGWNRSDSQPPIGPHDDREDHEPGGAQGGVVGLSPYAVLR